MHYLHTVRLYILRVPFCAEMNTMDTMDFVFDFSDPCQRYST